MTTARTALRLDGCRTTPLASYLKSIGVLRLVAAQMDDGARGWWEGSTFRLDSLLDAASLGDFLLHDYRPTPVLGPWNGGSGFYPGDAMGIAALSAIVEGESARFGELRAAIGFVQGIVQAKGYEVRPEKEEKSRFVRELRCVAEGGFLTWIDAAIALGTDDLLFPPLLGSGGNDGRLDFTVNFLLNLAEVLDPDSGEPTDGARALLDAALFGAARPGLKKSAIGQFAPGAAGGPNASIGFDGSPRMNPWDFILMIEGAILFATSAVRRLESAEKSVLAYPFTVRPTGAGSIGTTSSDASSARAEIWLPIWRGPSRLAELEQVFREGRLVVGNRSARDGLDVARAVAGLGVDRGIDALERYAFMQRSGNAYLATPLGQLEVQRRRQAELINDLDRGGWLQRFRKLSGGSNAPARFASLARQLEGALFELARRDDVTRPVLRALEALGRCQRFLTSSPSTREVCGPVPALGTDWAKLADDGSPEFALALALADLHGRQFSEGAEDDTGDRRYGLVLRTLEFMAPVTYVPDRRRGRWNWTEGAGRRVVWGDAPLVRNVTRMTERRFLDAERDGLGEVPLFATANVPLSIAVDWMRRPDWDARVAALVRGLALVVGTKPRHSLGSPVGIPVPAAFSLLKPYFTPRTLLNDVRSGSRSTTQGWAEFEPPPAARVVRLLAADRVGDAVRLARRELRGRGLPVPSTAPTGVHDGPRLLAALVLPLAAPDLRAVLHYFRSEHATTTNPTRDKDEN